jgi:hypothetical protein
MVLDREKRPSCYDLNSMPRSEITWKTGSAVRFGERVAARIE